MAWEWTDEQLVDNFEDAIQTEALHNSGLCLSSMSSSDYENRKAWKEALKERLAQLRKQATNGATGCHQTSVQG